MEQKSKATSKNGFNKACRRSGLSVRGLQNIVRDTGRSMAGIVSDTALAARMGYNPNKFARVLTSRSYS